jgi:hypothetical protein
VLLGCHGICMGSHKLAISLTFYACELMAIMCCELCRFGLWFVDLVYVSVVTCGIYLS